MAKDSHSAPEEIAELTEGAAVTSGFGVDARSIMDTWGSILTEASAQPRALFEACPKRVADLGSILLRARLHRTRATADFRTRRGRTTPSISGSVSPITPGVMPWMNGSITRASKA
jgi:hypothetical protein